MTTKQISVSRFKAQCTGLLRQMKVHPQKWQITNRGRVVAVVVPPEADKIDTPAEWLGSLRGTVKYQPGWDAPEPEELWEANR
jgi:antitoxin (DNA-binding transcriptional repressor) of toxin-antitoxin stability system